MDKLKSIALTLKDPVRQDKWFSPDWKDKLTGVKKRDDIPYLVFFGEMLRILDSANDVYFETSGYEEGSVYGPDFNWTLRTVHLLMSREHEETLSESWQSIEVISNSFVTEGFPPDFYIDWNGRFYPPVEITIGGITEEQADAIKLLAGRIFPAAVCAIRDTAEGEKLRSELKRNSLFLNKTGDTSVSESTASLCLLLKDEDENIAFEALEKLKEIRAGHEDNHSHDADLFFNTVSEIFSSRKKNKYVVRKICEYIGIFGGARYRDLLVNGLKEDDGYMEIGFIRALGDMVDLGVHCDSDIYSGVLKKCDSSGEDIRWAAAACCAKIINEKNKQEIFKKLRKLMKDPSRNVKSAAIQVLVDNADKNLSGFLISCLADDEDYVRQVSALKLADLGELKALPYLETQLDNENTDYVKNSILKAIKTLKDKQET